MAGSRDGARLATGRAALFHAGARRALGTLYWLTGTGASSTRLYWESFGTVDGWFRNGTTDRIDVPMGAAIFRDIPRPSRRWAKRRFSDIRYWSEPVGGGHFAAMDQPLVFSRERRASFAAMLG